MTMMGKTCPVRARAFSLSWDKRARRAAMSPLRTACFDIFSPPPGAREVMTQVERLSSSETKIALRSVRIAACLSGRGQRACMVAPAWVVQHPTLPESRVLPIAPMGSSLGHFLTAAYTSPSAVAFSIAIISNRAQTSTGGPSQTSRPNQPESVSHGVKLGVEFWATMYIPIVVAMAAQQNVVAAARGGPIVLIAGL